jgi:hypothetical protein
MVAGIIVQTKKGNPGAGRPRKGAGQRVAKSRQGYRKRRMADGRSTDESLFGSETPGIKRLLENGVSLRLKEPELMFVV